MSCFLASLQCPITLLLVQCIQQLFFFFFPEEGACVLNEFLQRDDGNVLVVEPLAKTVHEIMWLHRKLCPNSQTDMIGMCIFSAELSQNKFLLN
jgi:hypothetical protein